MAIEYICYIKKHSLQVLSNKLERHTNLTRHLKMPNDLDDRIDLSSLDQMIGPN